MAAVIASSSKKTRIATSLLPESKETGALGQIPGRYLAGPRQLTCKMSNTPESEFDRSEEPKRETPDQSSDSSTHDTIEVCPAKVAEQDVGRPTDDFRVPVPAQRVCSILLLARPQS